MFSDYLFSNPYIYIIFNFLLFFAIDGAHIAANGEVNILDCVFAGGFASERYASGIFHRVGASGYMFHQAWRPPRGIPRRSNAHTVAAAVLLLPAAVFQIYDNHLYEGLECKTEKFTCPSDPSTNCCSNMITIEDIDDDQGFKPIGEMCCGKILQVDELPIGHCCRELLECNEGTNDEVCVCNEHTVCASKNKDGNGVCCANQDVDSNGDCCARECLEWTDSNNEIHTLSPVPSTGTCTKIGKPMWDPVKNICTEYIEEGKRCQIDEGCSICTESTGFTCEKSKEAYIDCPLALQCFEPWMKSCKSPTEKCVASKPGKCIKLISANDEKKSKKINELLFGEERFEYNAKKKSYEYEVARDENPDVFLANRAANLAPSRRLMNVDDGRLLEAQMMLDAREQARKEASYVAREKRLNKDREMYRL